mgnify:CR=1 FL=1
MEKKIYVDGMFDSDTAEKVQAAVSAIAGVSKCVADPNKSQVLVEFDGDEAAITAAIEGSGVSVLG